MSPLDPAIVEAARLEQEIAHLLSSEAVRQWRQVRQHTAGGELPTELIAAREASERLQALIRELPTEALHAMAGDRGPLRTGSTSPALP